MNPKLSRRIGRILMIEPLVWLKPADKFALVRRIETTSTFEALPLSDQRLLLEAEANLERLIAEQQGGPKVAAG